MRISSVGFAFDTLEEVLLRATEYASVTHNHAEGIKGAKATAAAIFLARTGSTKEDIKWYTAATFRYDLSRSVNEIRPTYRFNESCQETVPEAIVCFLESTGFEDAIRNAISLGGDSDTLACITGGIAEAYYGDCRLWRTISAANGGVQPGSLTPGQQLQIPVQPVQGPAPGSVAYPTTSHW